MPKESLNPKNIFNTEKHGIPNRAEVSISLTGMRYRHRFGPESQKPETGFRFQMGHIPALIRQEKDRGINYPEITGRG